MAKRILLSSWFLASSIVWAFAPQDLDPTVLGCTTDRLVVSSQTIVLDYQVERAISAIGDRLVTSSGERLPHYTYRIIENPEINAFSTAGGYVYVNTGLLDFVDSEDMLAAVIAHELAHTNHNHQIEQIKTQRRMVRRAQFFSALADIGASLGGAYLQTYGGSLGARVGGEMIRVHGGEIAASICYSLTLASIKGYGRKLELEADSEAIQYLDRAGYDPNALITLFERLIAVRDRLASSQTPATSNLINADPGLELRIRSASAKLK